MEYMSVSETAKKWCVSERRVQKLCEENRIAGVIRFSRMWLIPKGAEKPRDARFKTVNKNNSQVLEERRKDEKDIDN